MYKIDHIKYKHESDLSLQILPNDPREWYRIIKNRSDATHISPEVQHVTKAVVPALLESRLKIAIFNEYERVKVVNFFTD